MGFFNKSTKRSTEYFLVRVPSPFTMMLNTSWNVWWMFFASKSYEEIPEIRDRILCESAWMLFTVQQIKTRRENRNKVKKEQLFLLLRRKSSHGRDLQKSWVSFDDILSDWLVIFYKKCFLSKSSPGFFGVLSKFSYFWTLAAFSLFFQSSLWTFTERFLCFVFRHFVKRRSQQSSPTFSPTFSFRLRLASIDNVKTTTVRLLCARKLISVR